MLLRWTDVVTLGDDSPVVVAIHSQSGVGTDALNKGAPLSTEDMIQEDRQYSHYEQAT